MQNSSRLAGFKAVAWVLSVVTAVVLAAFLPTGEVQAQGGIQQPAHVLGAFTANDCAKINAAGFIVSQTTTCGGAATAQQRVITFSIDGGGSAIATGDLNQYPTAAFACTINRVDVSGNPSGSITVDIWKAAGAIPTAANKISASAPASLSSSALNQNGSLTGWTTAVVSGNVFGGTVATASTVTRVTVQIWCS